MHPPPSDGVDLNRNFPDRIIMGGANLTAPLPGAAPETRAMMEFTLGRGFAASANLHVGGVVGGRCVRQGGGREESRTRPC